MLRTKYLLIGSWNTGVAFLVFVLLQSLFVPPLTDLESVFATYVISLPHSYLMQRLFVWQSDSKVQSEFSKFFVVSFFQLISNLILMQIAIELLKLPAIPSQLIVTGLLVALTYIAMRKWTFEHGKEIKNSVLIESN